MFQKVPQDIWLRANMNWGDVAEAEELYELKIKKIMFGKLLFVVVICE